MFNSIIHHLPHIRNPPLERVGEERSKDRATFEGFLEVIEISSTGLLECAILSFSFYLTSVDNLDEEIRDI